MNNRAAVVAAGHINNNNAVNNNTTTGSQACAACKYQRRKCAPNCPLSPFFPPNRQKDFLNAHKLFGVSNIMKTIKNLEFHQKTMAINSMVFQANVRANDPVGGCYRIICQLQRQIELAKAELEIVLNQLAICRAQIATHHHQLVVDHEDINNNAAQNDVVIDALLSTVYDAAAAPNHQYPHPQKQHQNYESSSKVVYNNEVLLGRTYVKVEMEGGSSSCVPTVLDESKQALLDVGEDIKPFLGVFDEREVNPFDSKDLIDQFSDKVVLKENAELIQHKQEHDLKDAASLFTLTNGKG